MWRRLGRSAPFITFGLLGAGLFVGLTDGGRTARTSAPLSEQIDQLLVATGFGINEVWLSGYRYTLDEDLFAALDLEHAGSLLRFDPRIARERLERLSWVDTANVTRVFPDKLSITIRERAPFALWTYGDRIALTDPSGRVLAHVTPSASGALPRISGAEAPPAASDLFTALRRYPDIAQKVVNADRVGGRRWTLTLESGTAILLPAEGQVEAIDRLADLQARRRILDQQPTQIDLRLPHRTAIKPGSAIVGGTPASGNGAGGT